MFKKPPVLKPLTPLRSSSRRAFLAYLQDLYPILASAPPELVLQVIPNGLKQCNAITSGNQKAVIYTDDNGKPLWFELGSDAGEALQQAQKKREKTGKQMQAKLCLVYPSIYTLWIIPNLLPRLPTWAQIVDPTLLSGSALMIPGLIPSPNTFPEAQQGHAYPSSSSIISITAYPSSIPMVVARLELDMKDICQKREVGEKGKAATTIHTKGDFLWEMGGKKNPPSEEEMKLIEEQLSGTRPEDEGAALGQPLEELTTAENIDGKVQSGKAESDLGEVAEEKAGQYVFTVAEVDAIMHLALIQALANVAKQPSLLPMSISTLYSSQVLPNRPAQWPPLNGKGRGRSRLSHRLVIIDGNDETERLIDADSLDIKHTSAKKLVKFIKSAEKNEMLKCKEAKGKDTVITSINTAHADFNDLSPYYTIAQASQNAGDPSNSLPTESSSVQTAQKTVVVIERFWKASASSVKLFQEMGASTSEPLSLPVIRGYIYDYITLHKLIDDKNQAQIRLEDPHLVNALYPKVQLSDIPASLNRQQLVDRLLSTSCVEYYRSSRLMADRAAIVQQINTKGKTINSIDTTTEDILEHKLEAEFVGQLTKGSAKSVTIEVKSRQGRKMVTLITGLEVYGMDPQSLAQELMKRGASASATALPTSTPKNPRYEVFVQGDQRKAVFDYIEGNGLDRRYILLHDGAKK